MDTRAKDLADRIAPWLAAAVFAAFLGWRAFHPDHSPPHFGPMGEPLFNTDD